MFSKKATKIDEIFTVDLTICSMYYKCQIDGEDFVNFCGLLRKQRTLTFDKVPSFFFTLLLYLSCTKEIGTYTLG